MLHDVLLEPQQERGLSGVVEAEEDNLGLFVDEAERFEAGFEPVYEPHGWFTLLIYTRMKKKGVNMDDSGMDIIGFEYGCTGVTFLCTSSRLRGSNRAGGWGNRIFRIVFFRWRWAIFHPFSGAVFCRLPSFGPCLPSFAVLGVTITPASSVAPPIAFSAGIRRPACAG